MWGVECIIAYRGKCSELRQSAHHAGHIDILQHLGAFRALPRRTLPVYLGSPEIKGMRDRPHRERHLGLLQYLGQSVRYKLRSSLSHGSVGEMTLLLGGTRLGYPT